MATFGFILLLCVTSSMSLLGALVVSETKHQVTPHHHAHHSPHVDQPCNQQYGLALAKCTWRRSFLADLYDSLFWSRAVFVFVRALSESFVRGCPVLSVDSQSTAQSEKTFLS
jgi:hypothetical protein